jgi:2-C-methyl-D-erythritol 4-phosphate cytidylyltransferase
LKKFAIIVAGGSGSRMKSEEPKQFLKILGKPVLAYTLQVFYSFDPSIEIIVVLPEKQIKRWEELKKEDNITISHKICAGGSTRFQSVKNGLDQINADGIVAIHDGVRPFVSSDTIQKCFETAEIKGSAVPIVPVSDSLRYIGEGKNSAVNRSDFAAIQTPQCFRVEKVKKAYQQEYREEFTDDASVAEAAGFEIFLTEGNTENIKITTPSDLLIAEAFAKNRN